MCQAWLYQPRSRLLSRKASGIIEDLQNITNCCVKQCKSCQKSNACNYLPAGSQALASKDTAHRVAMPPIPALGSPLQKTSPSHPANNLIGASHRTGLLSKPTSPAEPRRRRAKSQGFNLIHFPSPRLRHSAREIPWAPTENSPQVPATGPFRIGHTSPIVLRPDDRGWQMAVCCG